MIRRETMREIRTKRMKVIPIVKITMATKRMEVILLKEIKARYRGRKSKRGEEFQYNTDYRKNPKQNISKPLTLQVPSYKPNRLEHNESK